MYVEIDSLIEELDSAGIAESAERTRTECAATVTEWAGRLTVSYEEESEGGKISSLITVSDGEITVKRSGAIESEFIFREAQTTHSLYKIPPYSFDTEIYTKKIRNNLTEGAGDLSILYEMTLGGSKKRVRMKILLSEGKS